MRKAIRCAEISEPIAKSGLKKPRDHQTHRRIQAATWHRHLDRIFKLKEAKQAWFTVRYLSRKESRTIGIPLLYIGKVHNSDCAKASAFIQQNSEISGRKSVKDSRRVVMDLRCLTRSTLSTLRQQIKEALTPGELQQALSLFKVDKATGPDGIAPDFLKHLWTKWSSVLLTILKGRWLSSWCPQSWRSTYVVPLFKMGKDPADVGSYCQAAQTYTIGKEFDRLVANRLSCRLEEHSTHRRWQAGFLIGYGTTDQCLRLSQFLTDGFLSRKRRRTVATFFHFSRYYGSVWRTKT